MPVSNAEIKQFYKLLQDQQQRINLLPIPMHKSPKAFAANVGESKPIFMGLEWEVKIKDYSAYDSNFTHGVKNFLTKSLNSPLAEICNFRRDAALIEIVTIPATLRMHKKLLNKTLFKTDILSMVDTEYDDQEVGIHIHVDKDAFEIKHLERFIGFINGFETYDFMQEIADRSLYYDDYDAPQPTAKVLSSKTDIKQNGRYSRVNTDTGKNTVEVRIFRSQYTKEQIYARLEFIDALVRYTKNPYAPNRPECFVKYVSRYKAAYKNLLQEPCVKALVKKPIT